MVDNIKGLYAANVSVESNSPESSGRKDVLGIRTYRDNKFDGAYAVILKSDLIEVLKKHGITAEDFREPTPEELREAEITRLVTLDNGTVVERTNPHGDKRQFFKAGGRFTREDTGASYRAAEIVITGDTFTVKYPKED